jgi:predicted O-methyltransferase YrrM/transposase-like protein
MPMSDIRDEIRAACANLSPSAIDILRDMYEATALCGTESAAPIAIDGMTRISIEQGSVLHGLVREGGVTRSLEIGLAHGYSTVWILDALNQRDGAVHTAIDPFEKSIWHGIGLVQAGRLRTTARFEWVADYSIHALSRMIKDRDRFDFIYIDGNHRFDDVLVDFYLADQVMRVGGLMVFDDTWLESIQTVCNFVARNRAYQVVSQPVEDICVLRKLRDDDRDWHHFNRFEVGHASKERQTAYQSRVAELNREPALKAKVVLEVLKGEKAVEVIAAAHGVRPSQVIAWKEELLRRAKTFGGVVADVLTDPAKFRDQRARQAARASIGARERESPGPDAGTTSGRGESGGR